MRGRKVVPWWAVAALILMVAGFFFWLLWHDPSFTPFGVRETSTPTPDESELLVATELPEFMLPADETSAFTNVQVQFPNGEMCDCQVPVTRATTAWEASLDFVELLGVSYTAKVMDDMARFTEIKGYTEDETHMWLCSTHSSEPGEDPRTYPAENTTILWEHVPIVVD